MPSVGDLVARLMLDASNFKAGIEQYGRDVKQAKDTNKDFQAGLDEISNKLMTVAEVGIGAGAAIYAMGKSAAQTADDVGDLSAETGISVEKIYELKYIAGVTGTSFDQLSQNIRMFTVRMKELGEDSDIQKAFDKLGLDRAKIPEGELFSTTLKALRNVQSATEQTQLAYTIFGRNYKTVMDMVRLSDADWARLSSRAKELTGDLAKNNDALTKSNEKMNEMGEELKNTVDLMGSKFAPLIETVVVPAVEGLANAFGFVLDAAESAGESVMRTVLQIQSGIMRNTAVLDAWEAGIAAKKVGKTTTATTTSETPPGVTPPILPPSDEAKAVNNGSGMTYNASDLSQAQIEADYASGYITNSQYLAALGAGGRVIDANEGTPMGTGVINYAAGRGLTLAQAWAESHGDIMAMADSEGYITSVDMYGNYHRVKANPYAMAAGGVVASPTLAMIGEAGPEAVVPLSGNGSGGDVVVQLVVDSDVLGQAIFSKLSLLGGVK